MHRTGAEKATFAFRPDADPALRVRPGDVVQFETSPEPVERLFAAGADWLDAIDIDRMNAVTGPVYVEGVEPGDAVAVEILDVQPLDWAFSAFLPGFGLLGDALEAPMLRRLPIRDGRVVVSERLSLPLRPMIGCLGLAPADGVTSTLRPPAPWGGNYDLPHACAGNTILFPAQVPGGIFSLGDLHAAMGVAEPTYVAIECAGSATVRFGVRKGLRLETPRVETPDRVYTVGLHAVDDPHPPVGGDYDTARRQATRLMFAYLTTERALSPEDAYAAMSAGCDLELGGPAGAVVLAGVPLDVLG